MENLILALLLSLLAGLSTSIGSFIAFFMKRPSPKFISFIMGFSAGVMILISFLELLPKSIEALGFLMAISFFFLGMLVMFIIDVLISHEYEFEDSIEILINNKGQRKPHLHYGHRHRQRPHHRGEKVNDSLVKSSIFIFFGVFIHNFPEGMATFIGTLTQVKLGILLTIAIALHNIPEGIAVAVPIYACTLDKKKAFKWSFLSGMSEPLGAVLTWLILFPFINDNVLNAMLGAVGGIMVYISLDELLPVSRSLAKEHYSIIGIITGMFIMSVSLALL
ncbi:MAG: zinc transporter ZupT [Candidatus Lokiarchaeota archaeon]|nr:zinc transporter ZupT [Candidatus Lokiarchaeota archaeon]